MKPVTNIYETLDRIEARPELDLPSEATPLDFLRAVYLDPAQPMSLRVRAAVEAAPFAHPKLSAVFDLGHSFGARLEEAIRRSEALLPKPE